LLDTLEHQAKEVLLSNWRGGYTIPSPYLYPFQWLWDSGFIALGYSYFDEEKAWSELEYLFKGQWKNGLMPHIIFHQESDDYFPGPDIWQAHLFEHSRQSPKTSGIIQPPIIGFILEELYKNASDKNKATERVKKWLPRLHAFHKHLYDQRDPYDEGLIYIRHAWESGLDNSPLWDEALSRIDIPEEDMSTIRRDLTHIEAADRPTNREYQKYLWLVHLFSENGYDEAKIREKCPFLIQDPITNALLIKSNDALFRLSEAVGESMHDFKHWAIRGRKVMNEKLWAPEKKTYYGFDLATHERISAPSNAGFMVPLFGKIPDQERADAIIRKYFSDFDNHTFFMFPTLFPDDPRFEPRRYWRGPVWINTNWMLYLGLRQYGYDMRANRIRSDIYSLIENHGFFEYYNPSKKEPSGHGTNQFSWTAALYLDLLHRQE